ncbi:hypothetical protein SERLA73DRAFT_178062, partial [Serpula lacrymans var. lacrymans S7.3]
DAVVYCNDSKPIGSSPRTSNSKTDRRFVTDLHAVVVVRTTVTDKPVPNILFQPIPTADLRGTPNTKRYRPTCPLNREVNDDRDIA